MFHSYPESSSTKKQQEHGVSEPAVQLIVTRHGQSQQVWAVISSKVALETFTEFIRKQISTKQAYVQRYCKHSMEDTM